MAESTTDALPAIAVSAAGAAGIGGTGVAVTSADFSPVPVAFTAASL
jgi:hypothetical protein